MAHRELPELSEAIRFFLIHTGLLPGAANFEGWEDLTVGDMRLHGKPLTVKDKMVVARKLATFLHTLWVAIPNPYGYLKNNGLTWRTFNRSVYESQL